jgi:serine phosphatase RsbU (regulator of sigma subunit)
MTGMGSPPFGETEVGQAGAGWHIVRLDGDPPSKRARVRDETRIHAVLRHVQAHECVALLGPPMSEKTYLLLDVAEALAGTGRYAALYLDLWRAESSDEAAFFASTAQLIAGELGSSIRRPDEVPDARAFQNYLARCLAALDRHLVLLIDHLQALPPDLVHALLLALRSAYMEQDFGAPRQLVAVVSGGMNLVGLSTGSTSPFNVAKAVVASPITPEQTRELARATFEAHELAVSGGALAEVEAWAGGDPNLVSILCAECAAAARERHGARVTRRAVRQAAHRLWRAEQQDKIPPPVREPPIHEAIRMIEEDPDTMLDVLHLLDHGRLPRSRSRQAITRTGTDRLQLSGAVLLSEGEYRLKNQAYREVLARHFTTERVGHVLRIAGRWREAIDYLAPRLAVTPAGEPAAIAQPSASASGARPQLLEAVVQSIYAADSLERGGEILANGLRLGFGLSDVAVYRSLPAEGLLALIYPPANESRVPELIDLQAPGCVEAQALRYGNYALRGTAEEARLVAALTTRYRPIGVVTVERYVEHRDPHALPTELPDLLRFLQHAAEAVENVMVRSAYRAIGQAVLTASTLQDTVCRVLGAVSEALGCEFAHLYVLDATGTWLDMAAGIGRLWNPEWQARARLQRTSRHPAAACLAESQIVTVRGGDPRLDSTIVARYGLHDHTIIYLPLRAGGSLLGTLELGYPPGPPGSGGATAASWIAPAGEGRRSLLAFADQVAIAVHNVQLLQRTDEALSRRVAQLQKLRSSSLAISSTLDLDAVLARILSDVQSLFPGTEATIWESHPERGGLVVLQSSLADVAYCAQRLSADSVAGQVVVTGRAQLEPDLSLRAEAARDPAVHLGLRSMIAVPLISRDRVLGAISLYAYEAKPDSVGGGETELLQAFAAQAAVALDNARLHRDELARQRLEDELKVAREIQLSMLPTASPVVPDWEIDADYQAARTIGGDFYDFYDLSGEPLRLGMTVADVSGKGVPAAIFMGLSRTIIRTTAFSGRAPASALLRANELILKDSRSDFFLSAVYAVIEIESGAVTYANGGHNRPLWYHAATGQVTELEARGTVMGILDEISIEEGRIDMAAGDSLVLYTDGVTEAMDPEGEMFGEDRLRALIAAHASAGAAGLRARIAEALADFTAGAEQADDVTYVVVKRAQLP